MSENGSSIILASSMKELETLSQRIAKSELVPVAYRNKPDDIYVAMLMGNELGVGPMQSLQNIDVIDGRPRSRSRLNKVLALRNPNCEYFMLIEATPKLATYETKRKNNPKPTRMTYTIEEATAAGLTRKAVWAAHPKAMLMARCEGLLANAEYADSTLGLPADEFAVDEDEGTIIPAVATGVTDVSAPKPETTKGSEALKETLEKKKAEAKAKPEVQDALFTEDKKPDPKASPPKAETKKEGNFEVTKNEDGSETLKREPKKKEDKAPPPVGEQTPPRIDPPAVSENRAQPEAKVEVFEFEKPPAGANMETWFYEKCLALAKLRGLDAATLKAELRAVGAKGPKSVTEAHYTVLLKKYPPAEQAKVQSEPQREPGDDTDAIAAEQEAARKRGDLF